MLHKDLLSSYPLYRRYYLNRMFKFCVFYFMNGYTSYSANAMSYASISMNISRILFSASDNELRE
uniref:Uncharacterized protein n=1 Tax=Siphoviridae sp. ctK0l2 TaxID=2826243 RepID=A0A8S5NKH2_9CAUD|nr:MAG TPA: hypothetical protein [Siphoviridae sp. ctK0l2]